MQDHLTFSDRMTLDGAVNKTGIMLAVLFNASIAWNVSTTLGYGHMA